ncbi:MAG: SURF1 family protein [Rhodocyclaceae bacterium]|nr:SURF1 family protein [Rhodocyclaceae bacterium]
MRRGLDWLPYGAGVLVCVVTIQLGLWQTRRAEEKIALGEQLRVSAQAAPGDAAALSAGVEWTRVRLRGQWVADKGIVVDNRVYQGRVGYHVYMPLALATGETVLIKRGWLPAGPDRSVLPVLPTSTAEVDIEGRLRRPEARPYTLAAQAGEGRLWQYLDIAAYRAWSGLPVVDVVVEQSSASDDGMVRDWPPPDLGVDRHRGYAVQWFGLAALAAGLCGWFGWKRWQKR